MKKIICEVYDVNGKKAGELSLNGKKAGELSVVYQHDRIFKSEMRYYIPDSISLKDDRGIMLPSDTHGYVCHLFEPEVNHESLVDGTHREYTLLPGVYETEKEARDVSDDFDVGGLGAYDVVYIQKEKKWAHLYSDSYPNLLKGSSFLHVEFFDKSVGNRIFFCNFQCTMYNTPQGFCDVRQIVE